jgi:hypothetical protein
MKKTLILALIFGAMMAGCSPKTTSVPPMTVKDSGGHTAFYISFDGDNAFLSFPNGTTATLKQTPMASGIQYVGGGYQYNEWHGEIELLKDDRTLVKTHK